MPRSYALGDHFGNLIDELVKGGRCNNASEVVREGLRLLEDRETLRRLKVEEIRRSIEEGRRSGVTLTEEEVFGPLEARYAAMAGKTDRDGGVSARPLHTLAARDGLREIGSHIAQGNPARAESFARELRNHCRRLAAQPRLHRPREEFGPGVRGAIHGSYPILYTHRGDGRVTIERVVHGARDLERPPDD